MEDLIERIANARSDADWAFTNGSQKGVSECVILTRADCDALGSFLTNVFGLLLLGKRDPEVADQIAILGGAFEGEGQDDDD